MLKQPVLGRYALAVPAGKHRRARTATMSVRVCTVTLRLKDQWTKKERVVTVGAVLTREVRTTPHGEKPLEWLLLTTAPLENYADARRVIEGYRQRMGWSFPWVSSHGSDFNFDFQASFTPEELAAGRATYNFGERGIKASDLVGISIFYRSDDDTVFHTYSCYSRGVEMLNGAYHYLDLVPQGRAEEGLTFPQEWVRRHDQY